MGGLEKTQKWLRNTWTAPYVRYIHWECLYCQSVRDDASDDAVWISGGQNRGLERKGLDTIQQERTDYEPGDRSGEIGTLEDKIKKTKYDTWGQGRNKEDKRGHFRTC